jgi:uridine phosphorylase
MNVISDLYTSAVSLKSGPREHIRCSPGDVGGYVLLPGDPGRVPVIASHLDTPREIAYSREFRTITGSLDGEPVTVTSTGIGGPSAAIAVEELAQLGAHTFIRIGTSGAVQPELEIGELVVATAAVRDEGTSRQYVPLAYPAVADHFVTRALVDAAESLRVGYHVGVVQSKDSFYGQHEPLRMPAADELASNWRAWQRAGCLCSEMECAAVFTAAGTALGLRAGAVLAIAGNQETGQHLELPGAVQRRDQAVEDAIHCAVAAVRTLIATAI